MSRSTHHPVGTVAWGLESHGALSMRERSQFLTQAILLQMAAFAKKSLSLLGIAPKHLNQLELHNLRLPDSQVAQEAVALVQGVSPPWLVNHCLRTHLWAVVLAKSAVISYDEELLFVASILHDLGISDRPQKTTACSCCFALDGAQQARQFVQERHWNASRCDRLADAIALHLNVKVGLANHGAEAHLLREGAGMDVVGARLREMHSATIQAVLKQHPLLDFSRHMRHSMKNQAQQHPASRAALLVKYGFTDMIRKSPLREKADH